MRNKIMLLISIFLFIISVIISLIGIREDNNSVKIVAFILMAIVALLNIVRAINRWGEGK